MPGGNNRQYVLPGNRNQRTVHRNPNIRNAFNKFVKQGRSTNHTLEALRIALTGIIKQ